MYEGLEDNFTGNKYQYIHDVSLDSRLFYVQIPGVICRGRFGSSPIILKRYHCEKMKTQNEFIEAVEFVAVGKTFIFVYPFSNFLLIGLLIAGSLSPSSVQPSKHRVPHLGIRTGTEFSPD